MNKVLAVALVSLCWLPVGPNARGADAKAQLGALVDKVTEKLEAGKTSAADLADDLKNFDTLLAEHKDEKTDAVANILFMKAALYSEVLGDEDTAITALQKLKADFPGTEPATRADTLLAELTRTREAKEIQRRLVAGTPFPDFRETDLNGKPLALAGYRGKFVLIDFWATWCPPCLQELPNVLKTYQQYHDKGFEVVGVSLDQDKERLTTFLKEKQIPWPQYFDGKWWDTKLSRMCGVTRTPSNYLLDKEGKIIGKDLYADDLRQAVAAAVAAK